MARLVAAMSQRTAERMILVINSGSSSVKFATFDMASAGLRRVNSGALERIGLDKGRFVTMDAHGAILAEETRKIADHGAALDLLLSWVESRTSVENLIGVGHRVVHGGDCDRPLLITPEVEARLERRIPLAPLHLPHNLAGIVAVRQRRPELPQIACFDTAFHHNLPHVARMTGLPRRFEETGIRRYGFHGLSYEFIIDDIRRHDGDAAANAKIIVAHLGNGASMAAVKDGRSVETTMGFSTLAGLPMGTRSGDLDPGVLLYLLNEKVMPPADLQHLLYHESGLLGVSGLSRNMTELLARQDRPEATEAVDFFCYHARRHLAGLTASLGGLDRLVFTGGIGANSPEIRARICEGLTYLGIEIDAGRNGGNQRLISADGAAVVVQAFQTDEETVIAHHVHEVLRTPSTNVEVHARG